MKKKEKTTTEFFQEGVSLYFKFFEEKFGFKPSFESSSPRDLKNILESMKKRTEEKNMSWTKELSQQMLFAFFEIAYQDQWLKENFFLWNINRQKDKLFFKLKNKNNGTSKEQFTRQGVMDEISRRYSK